MAQHPKEYYRNEAMDLATECFYKQQILAIEKMVCPCDCRRPMLGGDGKTYTRCRLCSRRFTLTITEIPDE